MHLVGFIIRKSVTVHGHMNVKFTLHFPLHTHFLSHSKSLACQRGVILGVCEALEHPKLGQKAANELIKLLEVLASHSITSYELKQIFLLLREDADFHVS